MKKIISFLLLLAVANLNAQITDLGRTTDDKVRESFFNQQGNANTTIAGLNLYPSITLTNISLTLRLLDETQFLLEGGKLHLATGVTVTNWKASAAPSDALGLTPKSYVDGLFSTALSNGSAAGGHLTGTYPNPTVIDAAVLSRLLTGFGSTGGGNLTASDTILSAFGRLEFRMAANDAKVTGADRVFRAGDTMTGALDSPQLLTDAFRLRPGAGDGLVLTSDASGNGTWEEPTGISLGDALEAVASALLGGGLGQQFASTFENSALFTEDQHNGTGAYIGGRFPLANQVRITGIHGNARVSSTVSPTTIALEVGGVVTTNSITFPGTGASDSYVALTNLSYAVPPGQMFRMKVTSAPSIGSQASDVNIYILYRHDGQVLPPLPLNQQFAFNTFEQTPDQTLISFLKAGTPLTVNWGDGSPAELVDDPNGTSLSATHTYASAGVKTITLTSTDGYAGITTISLPNNKLTNSIPALGQFPNLASLHLENNQLTGTVPSLASNNIALIRLNDNLLSGSFPSVGHMSALAELYISNNRFSGSFPQMTNMLTLQQLYVGGNQFTGTMPNQIGDAPFPALVVYDISSNLFSVAAQPGGPSLENYNISSNSFSGVFNHLLFSATPRLTTFLANSNGFTTYNIGSPSHQKFNILTNLTTVNFDNNSLNGQSITNLLGDFITNAISRTAGKPAINIGLAGGANAAASAFNISQRQEILHEIGGFVRMNGLNAPTTTQWFDMFDTPSEAVGQDLSAFNSVAVGPDGSVYAAGYIRKTFDSKDFLLAKYQTNGILEWAWSADGSEVAFNGAADNPAVGHQNDEIHAIKIYNNEIYGVGYAEAVVAGETPNPSGVVLRFNTNGTPIKVTQDRNFVFRDLAVSADGVFIVGETDGGATDSTQSIVTRKYTLSLDAASFGANQTITATSISAVGVRVCLDSSGNPIFGGHTLAIGATGHEIRLQKRNISGTILWTGSTTGTSQTGDKILTDIAPAADGGAYWSGRAGGVVHVPPNVSAWSAFRGKLSNAGAVDWSASVSGTGTTTSNYFHAVKLNASGNPVFVGSHDNQWMFYEITPSNVIASQKTWTDAAGRAKAVDFDGANIVLMGELGAGGSDNERATKIVVTGTTEVSRDSGSLTDAVPHIISQAVYAGGRAHYAGRGMDNQFETGNTATIQRR